MIGRDHATEEEEEEEASNSPQSPQKQLVMGLPVSAILLISLGVPFVILKLDEGTTMLLE